MVKSLYFINWREKISIIFLFINLKNGLNMFLIFISLIPIRKGENTGKKI